MILSKLVGFFGLDPEIRVNGYICGTYFDDVPFDGFCRFNSRLQMYSARLGLISKARPIFTYVWNVGDFRVTFSVLNLDRKTAFIWSSVILLIVKVLAILKYQINSILIHKPTRDCQLHVRWKRKEPPFCFCLFTIEPGHFSGNDYVQPTTVTLKNVPVNNIDAKYVFVN